jgi:hypothetical protein
VPKMPEFYYDRQSDVLVGIETSHSGSLVLDNLEIDFRGVRSHIGPCVYQILCAESGICREQCLLAGAETACLFEEPYWNACPDDARLTAAYFRPGVDPGKASLSCWTTHFKTCARSPGERLGRSFSKSLKPGIFQLSPMLCGDATTHLAVSRRTHRFDQPQPFSRTPSALPSPHFGRGRVPKKWLAADRSWLCGREVAANKGWKKQIRPGELQSVCLAHLSGPIAGG